MNSSACTRNDISSLVSSIVPGDPIEKVHLDMAKQWIASGAEIYRITKPDYPNIHLVAYILVFDPRTNEFLLVDHKIAGIWLPAGGHVEIDEHPKDTVIREVKEELGIEAEFIFDAPLFLTVTETKGNVAQHTDVSLWYILKGDRKISLEFDAREFHQIRWFNQENLPYDRADPHMKRFFDKIVRKLTCSGAGH